MGLTMMEAAELAPVAVRKLMRDIGIPMKMSECGVTDDMIEALADDSLLSGNVALNPRRAKREDIVALLQRAL
jgi:alcohol dehydrogenase class IV